MGIYRHLKEWDSWAQSAEWNDAVERAGDLCGPLWHSAFAAHYKGPDATAAVLIAVLLLAADTGKPAPQVSVREVYDLFDRTGEAKGPPHPRNIYEIFGAALARAETVLAAETMLAARQLWETVLIVDHTPTAEQLESPSLQEDSFVRWGLAIEDVAGPIHAALRRQMGEHIKR
ncbi:hypothetical protein ETD86_50370 [Nonomuraea turkmeniaca]|uniref:Uncharacterized protein n=1 Tax=Nonomuraea turkmeniaca TaxID=103838 RepID=A0A5S4FFU2_9ACTN|nr:hypothetical protein [Nonomuraea turkmeniaca]TMR07825.1 hypothetical protein ETD86_50370 [Nonomuraea turkmeniaca]